MRKIEAIDKKIMLTDEVEIVYEKEVTPVCSIIFLTNAERLKKVCIFK